MRPGMTALAIPPFMHSSAHWLAFTILFGGGKIVTLPGGRFDPAAAWRPRGHRAVNILVVVGDAMARPLLDELEAHRPVTTSRRCGGGLGRRRALSVDQARLAEMLPGRIVADAFGSSETGQLGGERRPTTPSARRVCMSTNTPTSSMTTLRPVAPGSDVVGRLARSGHIPIGYLGDPARRPPPSWSQRAGAGRFRVTWPRSTPTGPSSSSAAARCASTPVGRRSSPTRWRRR